MTAIATARDKINHFEALNLERPQIDLQTTHHLVNGIYARTIFVPKGAALTGAANKHEHLNIYDGDITVWTEAGEQRITGRGLLVGHPGSKRAGFAHADTWWTTIHATSETDIQKIEDEMTDEAEQLQTRQALGFEQTTLEA